MPGSTVTDAADTAVFQSRHHPRTEAVIVPEVPAGPGRAERPPARRPAADAPRRADGARRHGAPRRPARRTSRRRCPATSWSSGGGSISPNTSVVVGTASDVPMVVDLVRDGPHGLVGGTSGSGKTEFLKTLLVSLCLNNHPDDLSIVIVDFKGGVDHDAVRPIPHVVDVSTNLDIEQFRRTIVMLKAESRRRQDLLASAGASNLDSYRLARRSRPELPALPRLLVVVDEFGELLASEGGREQLKELESITRIGRALGLNLLLVTQNFEGALPAQIDANAGLRICLRVGKPAHSKAVLNSGIAATIPDRFVGRAYARFHGRELIEFQTARVAGRRRDLAAADADVDVRIVPFETLVGPRARPPAGGRAGRGDRHVRPRRGDPRRRRRERLDAQRRPVADRAAREHQRVVAGVPPQRRRRPGRRDGPPRSAAPADLVDQRPRRARRLDRRTQRADPRGAGGVRHLARPAEQRRRRAPLRHRPARARPRPAGDAAALRWHGDPQRGAGAADRAPPDRRRRRAQGGDGRDRQLERLGARRDHRRPAAAGGAARQRHRPPADVHRGRGEQPARAADDADERGRRRAHPGRARRPAADRHQPPWHEHRAPLRVPARRRQRVLDRRGQQDARAATRPAAAGDRRAGEADHPVRPARRPGQRGGAGHPAARRAPAGGDDRARRSRSPTCRGRSRGSRRRSTGSPSRHTSSARCRWRSTPRRASGRGSTPSTTDRCSPSPAHRRAGAARPWRRWPVWRRGRAGPSSTSGCRAGRRWRRGTTRRSAVRSRPTSSPPRSRHATATCSCCSTTCSG